jgi:hypothetical protein
VGWVDVNAVTLKNDYCCSGWRPSGIDRGKVRSYGKHPSAIAVDRSISYGNRPTAIPYRKRPSASEAGSRAMAGGGDLGQVAIDQENAPPRLHGAPGAYLGGRPAELRSSFMI